MKKSIRFLLSLVLLAVFFFSITMVLRQLADNSSGSSTYDDALSIALSGKTEPDSPQQAQPAETTKSQETPQWIPAPIEGEDEHVQTLEKIDLAALRAVNPQVIGWILVPDSNINYPIMQGSDNNFYLHHTWKGTKNSVGSIFLEHRNTPDFTDFNTIVYGHNMNDGSMFANIKRYETEWYWERHPYVYILSDAGIYRYEVFASYKAELTSSAYGLSFNQNQTRVDFLLNALKESSIVTGVEPALTDRILTLSTCSGSGPSTRWVVHARLKMIQTEN